MPCISFLGETDFLNRNFAVSCKSSPLVSFRMIYVQIALLISWEKNSGLGQWKERVREVEREIERKRERERINTIR